MKTKQIDKLISEGNELITKHVISEDKRFISWLTKVKQLVKQQFGKDSDEYNAIKKRRFDIPILIISTNTNDPTIDEEIEACKNGIEKTIAELEGYKEFFEEYSSPELVENLKENQRVPMNKVFIVHGHNGELKESVARLIERQNIEAIILSEQANSGNTIIEKFEKNSDVQAAICLFTEDDIAKVNDERAEYKKRARQNVVFEAGYFMGKLSRKRVILVANKDVEMPSDLQGVIYTSTNNWNVDVLKELMEMGFDIDMNKLL